MNIKTNWNFCMFDMVGVLFFVVQVSKASVFNFFPPKKKTLTFMDLVLFRFIQETCSEPY